jgi:clan AA aspartic protease
LKQSRSRIDYRIAVRGKGNNCCSVRSLEAWNMGLTHVEAEVANPLDPARKAGQSFLMDSGTVYSVIPAEALEKLGIEPSGERTFFLANGEPVRRRMGEARITFQEQTATCVVLFGEEGDATLMGVTALENLGLIFDPMRQKIIPLPMLIADVRRYFA